MNIVTESVTVIPIAKTTVDASPEEEAVYMILGDLRREAKQPQHEGEGSRKGWHHHVMVQYVLYKLFLSSPEACIETVQKRLQHLDKNDQSNNKGCKQCPQPFESQYTIVIQPLSCSASFQSPVGKTKPQ